MRINPQLTRQVGEHLVTAELGRRGFVATPFAGNLPDFDLMAGDAFGGFIPIQVKAINGPSWQFDIQQFLQVEVVEDIQYVRGTVQLPLPDLLCVFVLLREPGTDEFYILRMRDLQAHFKATYLGGRRPRNPESMHCAIWPEELRDHRDRWQLVHDALLAVPLGVGIGGHPPDRSMRPSPNAAAAADPKPSGREGERDTEDNHRL